MTRISKIHLSLISVFLLLSVGARAEEDAEKLVEVEAPSGAAFDRDGNLLAYPIRRSDWGFTFTFAVSQFNPTKYQPDYVNYNYATVYGSDAIRMFEFSLGVKRNIWSLSLLAEAGYGIFRTDSSQAFLSSTLNANPVTAKLSLLVDGVFNDPYLVPYGFFGGYSVLYNEGQNSVAVKGNTQIAPFYGGGVLLSLNWLDRESASLAYDHNGLENTYLMLQYQKFVASSAKQDPNFETQFNWSIGLKMEY